MSARNYEYLIVRFFIQTWADLIESFYVAFQLLDIPFIAR